MKQIAPYYALCVGIILAIISGITLTTENEALQTSELIFAMLPSAIMCMFCIMGAIFTILSKKRGRYFTLMGLSMILYASLIYAKHYSGNSILFVLLNLVALVTVAFLFYSIQSMMHAHHTHHSHHHHSEKTGS